MSDLINRNDIYKLFEHGIAKLHVSDIDVIPTVDAEPVIHGYWVDLSWESASGRTTFHGAICSCCKERFVRKYNFCPNCGAKMDKELE